LIRQLHDDDQLAIDILDTIQGEDKRMADFFDTIECLPFLLGVDSVHVERFEIAVDELDGLEETAGGLALPDLAEAAAAERFQEPVAGDRLCIRFAHNSHRYTLPRGQGQPRTIGLLAAGTSHPKERRTPADPVYCLPKIRSKVGFCPMRDEPGNFRAFQRCKSPCL